MIKAAVMHHMVQISGNDVPSCQQKLISAGGTGTLAGNDTINLGNRVVHLNLF